MIKLGRLTDYAVAVMVQLSRESDACSAQALAEKTGLPAPTVAKVLKKLAQEKVIGASRGAAGGYKLLRAAKQITVCEVIEAMDGPIVIASCIESEAACKTACLCPTRGRWAPINHAIRTALQAVTIADMAAAPGRGGVTVALPSYSKSGGTHAGIE